MFALIDANSFYCSCECAFDPKLRGKPVAVLSNNDGCAIALTREAKDLGLKMGEPYHLAKKRPELASVIWRSSNYALYGDMSRRIYETLQELVPSVEPYSIDEMFLDLRDMPGDHVRLATEIKQRVRKVAKIPCCIGIGPTKTIAKLANKIAKQDRNGPGVVDYRDASVRTATYPNITPDMVWGIGPAAAAKLTQRGITNVAEFIAMPRDEVRRLLTVTGAKTQAELAGEICFPFSQHAATRKSLAVTRSFGRAVTSWDEMRQAVAAYATRAAEKLRQQGLLATAMQVFMLTSRFNTDPRYANQTTFEIEPTADTRALIANATSAAEKLWRDNYRYAKAGIVLLDLKEPRDLPAELLPSRDPAHSEKLMAVLDRLNARFGRRTLQPACTGLHAAWGMRREMVSPRYTTHIEDVLRASA